jgi:uncharacterized protein (UPF0332 family)
MNTISEEARRRMAKAKWFVEAARTQWANGAFSGSVSLATDAVREAAAAALAWRGVEPSDSRLDAFRTELVASGLVDHDHHTFWEDLESDRRRIDEQFHRFTANDSQKKLEQAEAFIRRLDTLLARGRP